MEVYTQEAQIILAIEAICISKNLSRRKTAKIYNILYTILYTILSNRIAGRTSICDSRPAVQKLIELEEKIII